MYGPVSTEPGTTLSPRLFGKSVSDGARPDISCCAAEKGHKAHRKS